MQDPLDLPDLPEIPDFLANLGHKEPWDRKVLRVSEVLTAVLVPLVLTVLLVLLVQMELLALGVT